MTDSNINLTSLGKAMFPDLVTPGSFHEDHARAAADLVIDNAGDAARTRREVRRVLRRLERRS